MGCDTKGYIKGVGLLELMGIVNQVMIEHKRVDFIKVEDITISTGDATITYGFLNFTYDPEANRDMKYRPVASPTAENRRLYIGSHTDTDPTVPGGPEGVWGYLSFGAWGNSVELMRLFLLKAKAKGLEAYLMENDCMDELPVRV